MQRLFYLIHRENAKERNHEIKLKHYKYTSLYKL